MLEEIVLEVSDLQIGFGRKNHMQMAVDGISFSVNKGEILGIVGESGSGKSLTAHTLLGLQTKEATITSGNVQFDGTDILTISEKQRLKYLGSELSIIFQEPMTSLNPVMKVGKQVDEMLLLHSDLRKDEIRERTLEALREVELANPEQIYEKYPHQLSGGMRQRVMIAMAMICKPKLMIADEPTTALDVSVQAQILQLIKRLNREHGVSVILISHDLGVIRNTCDRTIVMSNGRIVEQGDVNDIFRNPKEEYTRKLIQAVPTLKDRLQEKKSGTRKVSEEVRIMEAPILSVNNLNVYYQENGLMKKNDRKQIVNEATFTVQSGEIVGIVGESGSGKTTLGKAITGLNPNMEGDIILSERHPQMVFQDPYSSLNPAKKVGWILEEPLRIQGGYTKQQRLQKVNKILSEVGLPEDTRHRFVSQLSGGQRQRVSIAAALMLQSKFVVLDEPVSALDATIQKQIIELLLQIREQHGLTYLFISHDMNVIHEICDRVLVMLQGRIVEQGDIDEVFHDPKHEYTKKLLDAVLA
ncbi:MAG TPA: ABC transporter ATP-binding protein [Lachnospiraceae bacterium]|nr:ABC transporter ATP-binding protein [Lachnospiraceae bacterium]